MSDGRSLWAFSVVLGLFGSTCDTPATLPGAAAEPRTQAIATRPTGPLASDVRVDPRSPLGLARAALEGGSPSRALDLVLAALPSETDPLERGRLLWVGARAGRAVPRPEESERMLRALIEGDHPLAVWARVILAEDLIARDPAYAAELVAAIDPLFAGARRARIAYGVALARADRAEEAIPVLRAIVAEYPDGSSAAPASMPLAELLERGEDAESREEALRLYRRVITRAPTSTIVPDATRRAEAVLATLPPARRAALATLDGQDLLARARAYAGSMRHEEAERAFAEAATRLRAEPDQACEARLLAGQAMLRRRDRDRGAEHLERVARDCEGTDVRAAARYHAARAHSLRGRHAEAIALFDAVAEAAPDHRLADDALYRSALAHGALGEVDAMRATLARAAALSLGDMRGDARFALLWDARSRAASAPDAAARTSALEEALAIASGAEQETGEDDRGRAAYWRARTLEDLGRRAEAVDAFDALARVLPLSYYAQRSLARLRALDEARASSVVDGMRPPAVVGPLEIAPRPELDSPAMHRALELLRVGETALAVAEIESTGVFRADGDDDLALVAAAYLDAAGASPEASRTVRRRGSTLLARPPSGAGYHAWRIAYPHAFAPLVEDAARAENIDPALLRAIAREESAFDPDAISVAHAYGLVQLIEPTAIRFGREIGIEATPEALADPATSLRVGARYLAFLGERFRATPALVPAAYNAGENAVDRWLRERSALPLDAFVETIPYDETRRYTRRVLQTWGIYTWLDEGRLLAVD